MASDFWNWFQNWFLGSARDRELEDTVNLYARVKRALADSPLADEKRLRAFIVDLIYEICERCGVTPAVPLGEALFATIKSLLYFDGIVSDGSRSPEAEHLPQPLDSKEPIAPEVELRFRRGRVGS